MFVLGCAHVLPLQGSALRGALPANLNDLHFWNGGTCAVESLHSYGRMWVIVCPEPLVQASQRVRCCWSCHRVKSAPSATISSVHTSDYSAFLYRGCEALCLARPTLVSFRLYRTCTCPDFILLGLAAVSFP